MTLGDLHGRRALVTGAGQHTGRAFAMHLAAVGAEVLVNDIAVDKAEAVCREIRTAGGSAEPAVFDVTDLDAVGDAVHATRPDIVVNNVGGTTELTFPFVSFGESDPNRWHRLVDLNLYGVFNTTYAALPHMVEQGWGRIVTIISDAARRGERGMAVYAAAKAGAAGFMRSIAAEYGTLGITANAIAFGTLAYADHEEPSEERLHRLLRNYAVKRRGTPTDPVGLLLLLVSDAAAWITGQVIAVDGGYTNAL